MPELVTTTTGLFTGKTVTQMKAGVLSKLGENGYGRYTEAEILYRLDEAQRQFAMETRCLKGWSIVILKANRREYKLPTLFMDFINNRWPVEFKVASGGNKRIARTSAQKLINAKNDWRSETGEPVAVYLGSLYGNTRLMGVYPLCQADGVQYTAASDSGLFVSATGITIGGNISGRHKAGYPASAFYVDEEGRNFSTLGIINGMTIQNLTDGSYGQITSITNGDATNDKLVVTLTGGSDNKFDIGDSVIIYAGEYGVVSDWEDSGEKYVFSSEIGTIAQIIVPDGNIFFDYVRYPVNLSIDSQYPEIPQAFHEALEWRSAAILMATEHDGRLDMGKAAQYHQAYKEAVVFCKDEQPGLNMPEAHEPDEAYIGEL